ncbi:MAG: transposase [Thermoplasmatales archaeon]|nr:transposase [Thermoplasmatales archaeon]
MPSKSLFFSFSFFFVEREKKSVESFCLFSPCWTLVLSHFFAFGTTVYWACSSKKNLRLIDSFGGKPFIPFKKNATGKRGGALWRKTFHYFQLHKDEFLEHYHKRSNVESTFSAIKKKFGESVKSKNRIAQKNELLCKIIAYNITVLIHEMIQLNGTSEFLSFDGLQKEETLKESKKYKLIML